MLTVGYSTREHNPKFIEYLKKSSGFKKINVIEKINNGEKSLSQVYNEILSESETDVVVLCHDDIYFDTNSWYHKLIKHFEESDYGILGVAGTTHLPQSGQWWENRKKMVGIVNHENNGKKWESKYSESVGKQIIQTVIVDGLFIAVDKKKLKSNFIEDFKGFHFYDVSFSFENYLQGVKVGVITDIRITHKSIGMTNEQWNENKIQFAERYKDSLPAVCPFSDARKIKVLIACLSFKTFTGSELYVYELAKELMKLNCSVSVISNIGGPLTDMAKKIGIKTISINEPPGFKMGDGVWGFNNPNGTMTKSQPNTLYKISELDYDIIHIQHKPIAERMVQLYPEVDKIYSIHSEVIDLENPIKDPTIKEYIAIRPEIKEHLINNFDIDENKIKVIYNPIDNEKFKPSNKELKNYVLFVGTVDYLREQTIRDLIEYTKENNKELWLVGENKSNYLDEIKINSHLKYFTPTWNVEKYLEECSETAGIQLGRTTIEGWMSGKPSWIYKVDSIGNILSKEKYNSPEDVEKFYSKNVANQIKEEYIKVLS